MEIDSLIDYVLAHPGCSQQELAAALQVSERTVRNRVSRANSQMGSIAHIDHVRRRGYYLTVYDEERFDGARAKRRELSASFHPSTPAERAQYLLNDLLSRNDWVTLDDLSEILFTSRSVLSSDLKLVENKLAEYGLKLAKRPHYGMKVEGPELERRMCLAAVTAEHLMSSSGIFGDAPMTAARAFGCDFKEMLGIVSKSVQEALESLSFHVNSVAYQNLLVHISIALLRIAEGCYVPMQESYLEQVRSRYEYRVAQKIAELIKDRLGTALPEEEVAYIAIHLAAKQVLSDSPGSSEGLVISDEVWDVVNRVLTRVWESFKYDFRNDFELRMNLARHIVPLSVRLRYHMELKNPLIGDIKTHYLLAWSMGVVAGNVIGARYGSSLSNDELGYLALAFALALERAKGTPAKKRILMVCATGVGSARLLEYRMRHTFGDYIDSIQSCDLLHLDKVDFSRIDYVFTTVPIERTLPVPVCLVSSFFDETDAVRTKEFLQSSGNAGTLLSRFSHDLFFPHLDLPNKETVLRALCEQAMMSRGLDAQFEENVFARERASATSFGNLIAMPHPIAPIGDKTFVVVGILDHQIPWNGDDTPVQVVFLIALANDAGDELVEFFRLMSDFFMSERAVTRLVEHQDWDTLVSLLHDCEQGLLASA